LDKNCLVQAVVHYCGTWPTGRNTITGLILRIAEVLEIIQSRSPLRRSMTGGTSLPTWTSCRSCPRKESMFWPNKFVYVALN